MTRVVHFEIQAENPERAVAFYSTVFGWKIQRWGEQEYWLLTTGAEGSRGINGAIVRRRGPEPVDRQEVNAFVCTIDVPALDDFIAAALKAGATMALAKMAIPTIGWLAYCKDTEGNIFGMMQNDPGAS